MKLDTLYKRTVTGAIQQWTIFVDNDMFWTEEGQLNGVITRSNPTRCFAKNTGKANATTEEEQAILEAKSKHKKKMDRGYVLDINEIDKKAAFFSPMLAHKFTDRKDKINWTGRYFVQPKLDGLRAIITKDGATTRNGKEHKSIPHILDYLKPLFENDPDLILDGELYCHDLHNDFNKITSLVRKTKPTAEDLKESEQAIRFYCYDAPSIGDYNQEDDFSVRFRALSDLLSNYNKYVDVVETRQISDEKSIYELHTHFLQEGYEGIMIRIDGPYENKRSNNLLKYKVFDEDEFVIEGVLPGRGNKSNMAGSLEMHSKTTNEYFTSNIKATHDILENMLRNKEKYIGKTCTVRYFGLTPDKQIPRFPYMIDIDRWTYE